MRNKSVIEKPVKESSLDHGGLGGLTDDDHSQYHNDARGDARYYTQAQVTIQAIKWALVFGD